jgi:proliferating cell nuclear antigen
VVVVVVVAMQATSDHDDLPIWDHVSEPVVTIACGGDGIKPFLRPISKLIDEAKFRFTDDGVSVRAVDAANVAIVDTTLYAAAFNRYERDRDLTVGATLSSFNGIVKRARKRKDDELTLTASRDELRSNIRREADGVMLATSDATRTIDPDSIRQEPDIPDLRGSDEYDYGNVDLPLSAFTEAASHVLDAFDHIGFRSVDGDLLVEPVSAKVDSRGVRLEGQGIGVEGAALFSGDYMESIVAGLKSADVDRVTLAYAPESPVYLEAERTEDGKTVQEITFMMAPRVQSE